MFSIITKITLKFENSQKGQFNHFEREREREMHKRIINIMIIKIRI